MREEGVEVIAEMEGAGMDMEGKAGGRATGKDALAVWMGATE